MQSKSKRNMAMRWLPLLLLLVSATALGVIFFGEKPPEPPVLLTELTVEAGTQHIDPADFLTLETDPVPVILSGPTQDQLLVPGSYPISLTCGEFSYEATVHVEDTVPPSGSTTDVFSLGEMPEPEDFVVSCTDITGVSVSYAQLPDMKQNGAQEVSILLTDAAGNETVLTAVLTLDLDLEAPVIEGVGTFMIYQGDTIAYRAGVTVTDNRDAAPVLTIDTSLVNLSEPGEYTVTYAATDAAGNVAQIQTTVTVREKLDWFVDLDTVYAAVDDLLAKIIKPEMTVREQAWAIYKWIRNNCIYDNHSDKSDYLQAAYIMITKQRGDCFNYYAASKVMLDRLGIPNIDVRKVKNYEGDSDHYWSMVSVDGGETWYHFDTTPRGIGDTFFLVTDAYMDAFSAKYRNCFNRDKSLYPATPES